MESCRCPSRCAESSQEILAALQDAVVGFDSDLVRRAAHLAVSEEMDALEAITNGLAPGIEGVSELYDRGDYFLPELTMCADTFYAGLGILGPHSRREAGGAAKGMIVIGTVVGDRHDIGKNMVKLLLEAGGWEVCDLGVDVCPERFVRESIHADAALVCLSATLTTGLSSLPRIIDMLRMSSPSVRVIVGGSAVSEQDARRWGVHGYAADVLGLCSVVKQVMDAPPTRMGFAVAR